MRIKKAGKFILGIVDIFLGILLIIMVIINHKEIHKIIIALMCLFAGYLMLCDSIETKAERMKREEELKEMAKLYGWDKEEK